MSTPSIQKKKILFVITKSNFGGAQKYVFDLATGLPKEDFDVAVAVGGAGVLTEKLRSKGIRIVTLASLLRDVNPLKDFASFVGLWKIFRAEKPDIIHLNSAKASGLGALAGRLAGVPKIIFTAHGWAFNEERSFLSRILIKIFSWITVILSHKTIAVSESVRHDTKQWPFIAKKIIAIKNGMQEPAFLIREEARARLFARTDIFTPPDAFVLGTIAELHKNKGLGYAIEAFAKLAPEHPSLCYFILGGGEEKERLNALIDLYGLQGRVFLLGFFEDAARFLPAFDCFVLPSLTEALGLVLLEAGLARLPVIATNIGGIPEVIENHKTGFLVPARDPKAIVDAVAELLASQRTSAKLGTALREKVLSEFSLNRTLSETTELYTKN